MSSNSTHAVSADSGERADMPFGPPAEEILLETNEPEFEAVRPQSFTVESKFELNNPICATRHELTLFEEGYLQLRTYRRAKRPAEFLFDLRYLDPRPQLSRSAAPKMLLAAAAIAGSAVLLGMLALFSVASAFTGPAALIVLLAAAAAFWLFMYRTHERISFRTSVGQVPVFSLRANLGCIRACRALVPRIVKAIGHARQPSSASRTVYLRKEMRELYRLREAGALTEDTCSTGTHRILAQFD